MLWSTPLTWCILLNAICPALTFMPSHAPRAAGRTPFDGGTRMFMSLKPAALPLMDSGKALARSGELLIDVTTRLGLYGGGLSAVGANIRNCGDCLAQAAASCRFKTAAELVTDELREGATCLTEGVGSLKKAIAESKADNDLILTPKLQNMVQPMIDAGITLESAGAGIMKREPINDIGAKLISCGHSIEMLALALDSLDPDSSDAQQSYQRMMVASEKMITAGMELRGEVKKKAVGKAWLKG